ncbi:MAG: hypothetical protein QME14_03235 [Methanobacteriaceae archaeon]|nr:hypothetical protein [Methanobacteriaceae archaeon]
MPKMPNNHGNSSNSINDIIMENIAPNESIGIDIDKSEFFKAFIKRIVPKTLIVQLIDSARKKSCLMLGISSNKSSDSRTNKLINLNPMKLNTHHYFQEFLLNASWQIQIKH